MEHFGELILLSEGHIEHLETLSAVEDRDVAGNWIAMGSVWYLAALIPKSPDFKLVTQSVKVAPTKAGEAAPTTRPPSIAT